MLVAGAPNTGKSSLINALRRACSDRHGQKLRSRKPARTGALPGVTRGLGGFQVSVRPPVWLLDTPGVLPPRIDSWEAALRLGALDLIKEGKGESEALGSYILHLLSRLQPDALRRGPPPAIATTHAEEAPAAEEAEQDFEMAGAEERRAIGCSRRWRGSTSSAPTASPTSPTRRGASSGCCATAASAKSASTSSSSSNAASRPPTARRATRSSRGTRARGGATGRTRR